LTFTTQYTYNENNDMIQVTYPDGKKNVLAYNELGLVTEVKNNDGTKTTLERDSRGDVIAMVDEANRRVELTRDVMGRVIQEKSPGEKEVSYQWGGEGCSSCGDGSKLSRITDAAGHSWEFQYDLIGNPLKMIYPDGTSIQQEYDIAGRLSKFTNKRGQEIAYTYDPNGKLVKKTTPEGDIDFTYDNRDRIKEIQGVDFHYRYQYGHVGGLGTVWQQDEVTSNTMLQTVTQDFNDALLEIYDSFGWYKRFEYEDYGYTNSPNMIWNIRAGTETGALQGVQYNTARRPTSRVNLMFQKEEFLSYDANGMLKQNRYRGYGGTYIFNASGSLNFSRDTSGLITGITGDKELSAIYDPDLQISSINHTLPQAFAESYTYDDNGNRLTSLTNTFIYDDLNKLTESSTHEYAYDADGNMTSERNKLTGETRKYYWDSENRLIRFEHLASDISPVDTAASYKYDIFGRRLRKDVNGAVTNFFWENDTMTYELDASYQPIRKYLVENGIDSYEGHLEYSEITDWPHIFDENYISPGEKRGRFFEILK
jgi:YD repeat-containing protein